MAVEVLVFLLFVLVVLGPILYLSIRVVREYQRLVIFRLGRCIGFKGPGLVFLIPFIDRATSVDLREVYLEIPK
ncbi:MAG: slipin family protein, partial [Chloroflexi bacterium]|nr:slipin family protein [Chloroflexota bacterium]